MDQAPFVTQDAEDVRWACRLVLGCEPESDAVTEAWRHHPPGALLASLTASPAAWGRLGPVAGSWMCRPLPAPAVSAAYRLLRGADPSIAELAATLRAHASLASFRLDLRRWIEAGIIPDASGMGEEHPFQLLGRHCTLRGEPEGVPVRRPARLARLAASAFPDGGAGRVLVDAHAGTGLGLIAMGIALPYHADLLAIEPGAEAAGLLRHNLLANELHESRVVEAMPGAEDLPDLPCRQLDAILAEQELERIDLLRLAAGGQETAVMLGAAQAIRRDRPIVFAEFNLWNLMTVSRENPQAVLEEWHAAFPHLVGFDDDGDPLPIPRAEGLSWLLHAVLNRRGGVDDVVLCHDLGWVERWA